MSYSAVMSSRCNRSILCYQISKQNLIYWYFLHLHWISTDELCGVKGAVLEFERQSRRCEEQEKWEKAKAKEDIVNGDKNAAEIHVKNAIRRKDMKENYLRLSARVNAVAVRVGSAIRECYSIFHIDPFTKCTYFQVTSIMVGVIRKMRIVLASKNFVDISSFMDMWPQPTNYLEV